MMAFLSLPSQPSFVAAEMVLCVAPLLYTLLSVYNFAKGLIMSHLKDRLRYKSFYYCESQLLSTNHAPLPSKHVKLTKKSL